MYKVISSTPQTEYSINPADIQWDLVEWRQGHFHILWQGQTFRATVLEADYTQKTFKFDINGRVYTMQVKDAFDQLAEKMGLGNSNAKKANQIKAPMPGLVLSIAVAEGQSVKKGDALLILEAMKMENVIKAAHDAVVKKINVQKGVAVEKNQILVEFV